MNNTNMPAMKKSHRSLYVSLAVILGVLGLLAGFGSGTLQYGIATVQCMRAPVAATTFMASSSYDLPGDSGYGPNVFNRYFCTEQEAQNAGFHR